MKTLLTSIILSTSLITTATLASPRFEGHNMRTMNADDRIQLITDRMTEQGMTAEQIQTQIDTIQTRLEAQNGHMQNQEAMQERMVKMQNRMSEQGEKQQERMQKMEQMRNHGTSTERLQNMEHEKQSSLSEEERIAKITARMTEQGYSQADIDLKITEMSAHWAQQ